MTKITKLPPISALGPTDLIPVVGDVSTTPKNYKATGAQVQDLANKQAYISYGTGARSNDDRFGEAIHVGDYLNGVAWNGGNDGIPAIHRARDAAIARGRGRIVMPPGNSAINSPVDLRPAHGYPIELVGYGAGKPPSGGGLTQLSIKFASPSAILVGDTTKFGTGRTQYVRLKDFAIANALGPLTLGSAAIDLYSCDDVRISNLSISGVRRFLNIGNSTNADDAVRVWVGDCNTSGSGDTNSADCHMMLGSAAELVFNGQNFFNGAGFMPLFQQPSTSTKNVDGIMMGTDKCAAWTRFLDIQGMGLANGKFIGTWHDRAADYAVYFSTASGGKNKHVKFIGCNFENDPTTATTNSASAAYLGGVSPCNDINFIGCDFIGFGDTVIDVQNSTNCGVKVSSFVDCACNASLTPAIVSTGATGTVVVQGNTASAETATVPYRGIAWGGASNSTKRGQANNFWGPATNADSGTV